MNAGFGLAVRWSLAGARSDVSGRLREYVVGTSLARFMFLEGLAFKVWRMRDGEWFEGTYVFDTAQERDAFQADRAAQAEFWRGLAGAVPPDGALKVSLFGYAGAPYGALLDAMVRHAGPVWIAAPEGVASQAVSAWRWESSDRFMRTPWSASAVIRSSHHSLQRGCAVCPASCMNRMR